MRFLRFYPDPKKKFAQIKIAARKCFAKTYFMVEISVHIVCTRNYVGPIKMFFSRCFIFNNIENIFVPKAKLLVITRRIMYQVEQILFVIHQ